MSIIYNAVGDKVGVGKHPNTQAVWPEHDLFTEYLPLQLGATKSLRKFLTSGEGYKSIEGLVHKRTVQRFLRFLVKDRDPELQHEAAYALADLAFWNIGILIDDVPIFVEHTGSEDDIIRNKAFGVLEKIAGKSHQCCDMLLGNGAVDSLKKLLETQTEPSQLRQRNWTLSKLCRDHAQNFRDQVIFAVAQLKRVYRDPLLEPDLSWRCTSLYFLSEGTNGELEFVRDVDACEKLVALLEGGDNFVAVEPVLGAIEAKVDIEDIQKAMHDDVKIQQLCDQLTNPDFGVLSEALRELFIVLCQAEKNLSSCLETFAEAHGFDRLKKLKLHENYSVSSGAGLLLTLYYQEPEADDSRQQSDAASQPGPCPGGSLYKIDADSGPVYVDSRFGALTSGSGDIDPSLYSPIHSPYGASGLGAEGIGPAVDSPMGRLVYYSPTYHTGTGVLTSASRAGIGSSVVAPSAAPTSGSGGMDPFAAAPSAASTSGSGGIGPSAVAPSAASTSGSGGMDPSVHSPAGASASDDSENIDPSSVRSP